MSVFRRWYNAFRILGYAAGLAGMGLFMTGGRSHPPRRALQAAGGWLLLLMFACFLVTYALWGVARWNKARNRKKDY